MRFSTGELFDLAIAWVGVSLAFTIASAPANWLAVFLVSVLSAGLGVALHELAHKHVANSMGYATRFVADRTMIAIGVVVAFTGWIFLAPGGVHIRPAPDARREAIIAIAGPGVNIALALVALLLAPFVVFASLAAIINAYLALFNLIPIPGFDGRSVWAYNKTWSIGAIAVSALLLFVALGS